MGSWEQIQRQPWYVLPIGLGILVILWRRRWLAPGALDAGPSRSVGLMPADLLVGFGFLLLGMSVVAVLAPGFGDGSTMQMAGRVLLSQTVAYLPPVVYLLWRANQTDGGLGLIGVLPRNPYRDAACGAVGVVVALPLVFTVMILTIMIGILFLQPAPQIGHDLLKTMMASDSVLATMLLLGSAVIAAPFLEEAIFRGLLQSVLVEVLGPGRRWQAVFLAALAFGMIHVGSATFDPGQEGGVPWQAVPALCTLGLILGWLYEHTGSLWPPVIVHGGFNAFNAGFALLFGNPTPG